MLVSVHVCHRTGRTLVPQLWIHVRGASCAVAGHTIFIEKVVHCQYTCRSSSSDVVRRSWFLCFRSAFKERRLALFVVHSSSSALVCSDSNNKTLEITLWFDAISFLSKSKMCNIVIVLPEMQYEWSERLEWEQTVSADHLRVVRWRGILLSLPVSNLQASSYPSSCWT